MRRQTGTSAALAGATAPVIMEGGTIWDKLIAESRVLEATASKIQGGRMLLLSQERIQQFIHEYQSWYGECLSVLPDDLKDTFRSEYTGNWYSAKIKKFLEAPGEPSVLQIPGASHWQNPYKTAFYQPLLAQRQILLEASKRKNQQRGPSEHASVEIVERLARGFHIAARQLLQRHHNRPPFVIDNEYDVQDLFHAMLRPFFEDIRAEEWTPSYAGGSSRVDFLLKAEQVVVEIKKTRQGLDGKEVGDQLLIDIARYRAHPECKTLIALVYDPEMRIDNPKGLVNDLEKQSADDFKVKIIITPS